MGKRRNAALRLWVPWPRRARPRMPRWGQGTAADGVLREFKRWPLTLSGPRGLGWVGDGHPPGRRPRLHAVVAPDLAPAARARQAMAQAHHVPRDRMPVRAVLARLALHVAQHLLFHGLARARGVDRIAEERAGPLREPPGVVVGLAPHHPAIPH